MDSMLFPSLITLLALLELLILGVNVSRARRKFGIFPPKMFGHDDFERHVRIHENTAEQIILLLPSMWIFGIFVSYFWAGILGLTWIIGRLFYAFGYAKAPEKRFVGVGLSTLPTAIMIFGGLIKVILLMLGLE